MVSVRSIGSFVMTFVIGAWNWSSRGLMIPAARALRLRAGAELVAAERARQVEMREELGMLERNLAGLS